MIKILVTGSGGFIFSNFIRYIIYNKLDYNLVSIDKIKKFKVLDNVYTNKNHKFYIGDISDAHFINVIFEIEKPDIVINGAAQSFVDSSIHDVHPFITSNILGTQVIIDACLKWNVKKLVQVSTDEVFGHLEKETDPAWDELAPLNPRNPYSASKASAELLIKAAHHTHGLTYNITRACNNYGPRQDPEKFIPKIIKHILEKKSVPVYGKGSQIRDWIHVFDKCAAIIKIIQEGKDNEIYNISANQEYSNVEIFQIICNKLGRGHGLLEFVKDRPGHDFRYSVNSSKLRGLGWKPEFKFAKEGIHSTVQWYLNNQWFLR